MDDGAWDALASELTRQNYAFVASFSVIIWDCLITFRQEVKYVWYCPSRVTKYLFLLCRYCAVGYFIVCSIFVTQWTNRIPTRSKDCRTLFLMHVGSLSLPYIGSQFILIRKVFKLYGRSTLLATGLFALHCIQVTGSFIVSRHISASMDFDPICNGSNIPKFGFSVLASVICTQCITWALILRKVWRVRPMSFLSWCRYLRTSKVDAKMSWVLCIVAIMFNASRSFANQRIGPIYVFTFPMTVLSVGTCRYILRVEKDRDARAKLPEATSIDTAEGMGSRQLFGEEQSHGDILPTQNRHRHSYPPRPLAKMPLPLSDPEVLSIRASESQAGEHNLDTVVSNFPYLHGAQSYKLRKNRKSMDTTITNDSPRSSSDYASQQTVSARTSPPRRSRSSGFGPGPNPQDGSSAADSAPLETRKDLDETHSASNIEIGSLHSSSSVDSEELRRFYNDTWNVGPFMAGGP